MDERTYLSKSLQIASIMLPCCLMFKLNFLLELHKLCSLVILSDVKVINFLTCLLKLSLFLKLWFFMSLFIPLNLLILHLITILIFFFYSGSTLPCRLSFISYRCQCCSSYLNSFFLCILLTLLSL